MRSPSTARYDRVTKRNLYNHHRVPHLWLIDPEAHTLEALRLDDGAWTITGSFDDSAVARIAPFEEVELEVGRLFLPAPPAGR